MSQAKQPLDASSLKAFENAAAGHDGVLSNESGELIIKPCTDEELDFYQQTLAHHPDFAELMPTFIGSLQLGSPAQAPTNHELTSLAQEQQQQQQPKQGRHENLHGAKIPTKTAVVLENLEHGFTHPNVLDLKLGARLYADGTRPDKALRLDKVASETTSGTLNFRIAGMKVWNGTSLDVYDKFYGRQFTAETIAEGFETFFKPIKANLTSREAATLLQAIQDEITKARNVLERVESRMYSASVLIVYEGDAVALKGLAEESKAITDDVRTVMSTEVVQTEEEENDDDLEEEEAVPFKVKMIDFAHAKWTPRLGTDENVTKGLRTIEGQLKLLTSSRVAG
nr:inositol polyphosphate multikinase [Quercus suber]